MSIKRWNGTSEVDIASAKRFDGSNWIDVNSAKRFDGSNWVEAWSSKKVFKLSFVTYDEMKSLISLSDNNKTLTITNAKGYRSGPEIRFECFNLPLKYGDTIEILYMADIYTNGVHDGTRLLSSTSDFDSNPLNLNYNGYHIYNTTVSQPRADHAVFKYSLNKTDYTSYYNIHDTIDKITINGKEYDIEFSL